MTYAEIILPEFDAEMASTRRVLERIPDDKFDWKAHPRSHTIGWNANHVADIPSWFPVVLGSSSFDIAPVGEPSHVTPKMTASREILELFDRNVEAARKGLAEVDEKALNEPWTLAQAGVELFTMPRRAMLRNMLNHLMHHRAHLCVYLRLNDVPVPGMYGPSGDE